MNEHCRHCKEPLPTYALHFSNEAGIANGYCSYFFLLSELGDEKALKVVQKYLKKTHEIGSTGRPQRGEYSDIGKRKPNRGNSGKSGISDTLKLILSDDPEEVRDRA